MYQIALKAFLGFFRKFKGQQEVLFHLVLSIVTDIVQVKLHLIATKGEIARSPNCSLKRRCLDFRPSNAANAPIKFRILSYIPGLCPDLCNATKVLIQFYLTH